jgi:hypothetical protein
MSEDNCLDKMIGKSFSEKLKRGSRNEFSSFATQHATPIHCIIRIAGVMSLSRRLPRGEDLIPGGGWIKRRTFWFPRELLENRLDRQVENLREVFLRLG